MLASPTQSTLLDSHFNSENSKVEVAEGNATVKPMLDGRGFVVTTSGAATDSGYITLLITLGANGSGGRYYYTYHFDTAGAAR